MTSLFGIVLFVLSSVVLVWSGGMVVRSLSRIAAFLQVSEYVVAFVLVGVATSLPEISVSVSAAFAGDSVLAFSNNIGSNILYATLLLGLAAIVARRLSVVDHARTPMNVAATVISLLPFLFLANGVISRLEGGFLLFIFAVYFAILLRQGGVFKRAYHDMLFGNHEGTVLGFLQDAGKFTAGVALLLLSSTGVVQGAEEFAESLAIPIFFIGVFLVAFGVALPELVFTLRAVMSQHRDMIIGNLFGSLVINSGLAVGLAAVISPIVIAQESFLWLSLLFAGGSLGLLFLFGRSGNVLTWREGLVLLFSYFLFAFLQLALE